MARNKKDNTLTTRVVSAFRTYVPNTTTDVRGLSFFLSVGIPETLRMLADAMEDDKVEMIGDRFRLVR